MNLEIIKKKKGGKLILPKCRKLVFIRVMHDKFYSEIMHHFINIFLWMRYIIQKIFDL